MIELRTKNEERSGQGGFTIIELMISTLIFALVMLLITIGVISFSKAYYKGLTASNTQSVARTTLQDISQSIQFSGLAVVPTGAVSGSSDGSQVFCIGSQRYSYLPHFQLEDKADTKNYQNTDVLMRDTVANCTQPQSLVLQKSNGGSCGADQLCGTELLAPHMRIAQLSVVPADPTNNPNLYAISMRIVFGAADLLNNPTGDNATCRYRIAGSQFCAVSQLSTTVQRRIGN